MNTAELFSSDELEEIKGFCELAQEMKIDGKDVVCFEQLLEITQDKTQLSELSEFKFRDICEQFEIVSDIFLNMEVFDSKLLESIKIKLENAVDFIENKQFEENKKES